MIKLFAKKSLGQNFLINPGIVAKIIEAAELTPEDTVLEVGPGTGILTKGLVASGARVIAVEKDRRVIEDLNAEFSAAQIEIIEGDILEFKPAAHGLKTGEYKIVANLPYYITSHFLRIALEDWPRPKSLVLMVQKEVAQRMMAAPPNMNLLALSVQYFAQIEKIMDVSRGSFRPMPKVESSVIRLRPKPEILDKNQAKEMFRLAGAAFAGKRKQLVNTLPGALGKNRLETEEILWKINIDPTARPETLNLEDWLNLTKELK